MVFFVPVSGARLRSGVFVAGLSAAALGAFIFLYRWRRRDQQREPLSSGEITRDAVQDEQLVPDSSVLEDVTALNGIFLERCGPLISIRQFSQDVRRARRLRSHTLCDWFSSSDATQLVNVQLRHTSRFRGLESEHWWGLTNTFYKVSAEPTPQHFVEAVAYIKRVGGEINDLKVYLRTESSVTCVISNVMKTTTSRTFKGVSMKSDGTFDSSVETCPADTDASPAHQPPSKTTTWILI